MKKMLKVFCFFSLFLVLTTYNSVEAKTVNNTKKVKTEKLEEGRIINVPVNEAKEVEMFTKVDITKMRAKDVLEEFDRYAQMYNGKIVPEIDEGNKYQFLNINWDWKIRTISRKNITFDCPIVLYRDIKTNKLFTGRMKDREYSIYYYEYIYDGLYKRSVTRERLNAHYEEEKIGNVASAEEISYADNGEIYIKRLNYAEDVRVNGNADPIAKMDVNEENSQAIQNVRRYEKIDIIIVYVGVQGYAAGTMNITETIYYVWDNKTGKFIAKLRKVENKEL